MRLPVALAVLVAILCVRGDPAGLPISPQAKPRSARR